jgi:hypothetical protein
VVESALPLFLSEKRIIRLSRATIWLLLLRPRSLVRLDFDLGGSHTAQVDPSPFVVFHVILLPALTVTSFHEWNGRASQMKLGGGHPHGLGE